MPFIADDPLIEIAKISTINASKSPLTGGPWNVLLSQGSHSNVWPLLAMVRSEPLYNNLTHATKSLPKLKASRAINKKKTWDMESKAILKSSAKINLFMLSVSQYSMTSLNPRPPGGSDPTPLGFSLITSVSLQISKRNLPYLSVHQFYATMPNFGRFCQKRFDLYRFFYPMSWHFWP